MKVKILGVVLFIVFFSVAVFAAEDEDSDTKPIQLDIATTISDKYVGSCGVVNTERLNFQTGFRATYLNPKCDIYGEIFTFAEPSGGLHSSFGDEADYTLGINKIWQLGKEKGIVAINAAGGFYDVHDLGRGTANNFSFARGSIAYNPLLKSGGKINSFQPYVGITLEKDWATNPNVLPGGIFWGMSCGAFFSLAELNKHLDTVNFEIIFGGHNGLCGFTGQSFSHTQGLVSVSAQWGSIHFTPAFNWQVANDSGVENPIAKSKIWPSFAMGYSW
ncbi:MAG: hypothetical protein CEN90_361 [Parcubacteria group bacterium Licking1014_17]|nr:MAG: hypothetical protein CEN90_361 [Parcubacteria group bacterium Licking1014_17]